MNEKSTNPVFNYYFLTAGLLSARLELFWLLSLLFTHTTKEFSIPRPVGLRNHQVVDE